MYTSAPLSPCNVDLNLQNHFEQVYGFNTVWGGEGTSNVPMAIVFARHKANVQTKRFFCALMKVSQDLWPGL